MPETLGDRQFEAYRRVQPGRLVKNRGWDDSNLHHEEFALAVVDPEGNPVADQQVVRLLNDLLLTLQVTNKHLEMLTGETIELGV